MEYFLIIALIFLTIGLLKSITHRQKSTEEKYRVSLPRLYLIVGLSSISFIVVLGLVSCVFPDTFFGEVGDRFEGYIVFAILAVFFVGLGLYIVLGYFNWEIRIKEYTAYYRTIFRHIHVIKSNEIEQILVSNNYIRVKAKGKVFWVDRRALNIKTFETFLKKTGIKKKYGKGVMG